MSHPNVANGKMLTEQMNTPLEVASNIDAIFFSNNKKNWLLGTAPSIELSGIAFALGGLNFFSSCC